MYKISEFSKLLGMSRTAVLYYEKLGLIESNRLNNGYRVYDEENIQRVRLIQQLQNGGLTLKECKICLEHKIDKSILERRYKALKKEIQLKMRAIDLLESLLGLSCHKSWHDTLSSVAPDAHLDWLKTQGNEEKEALRLKWLSKNMNEHEQYMQDFMTVFESLERWGPGSKEDTIKAYDLLQKKPKNILEVGCGKGISTIVLAEASDSMIIATDNEKSALDRLEQKLQEHNLTHRVSTNCISMTNLNYADESFDAIWSETSIYIMGVEKALKAWKPMLEKKGVLVFSDLVWHTKQPDEALKAFWDSEYPDMQTVNSRITLIQRQGYNLISTFSYSKHAMENYYAPLKTRVNQLKKNLGKTQAIRDLEKEIEIYESYSDDFGYQMFVIEKP